MRGKRAKKYRKLMQQYSLTFGFREPYQILVTPSIVLDAARLKIDLVAALNRTVQGTGMIYFYNPLLSHANRFLT
jgi:U3 small nucleolar RNA-associated protein 23